MHAREALVGKWQLAVGTTLVYFVVMMVAGFVPLLPFFLSGPMTLGLTIFTLSLVRNTNSHLEQIFEGFRRLGTSLVAWLLIVLYVLLWSLLLIVPGIIASLSYAMTFYIIADDATVTPSDAIRRSKKMMMNNKWRLFCLGFRFIGWVILACLTFGIGFLWLIPYMQVSFAKFYEEVKGGGAQVSNA